MQPITRKPGDPGYGLPVTHRIKEIKQPYGGYLSPKLFVVKTHGKPAPHPASNEKISPMLMGITVDNMSRYFYSGNFDDAFEIAIRGYQIQRHLLRSDKKAVKHWDKYYNFLKTEFLKADKFITSGEASHKKSLKGLYASFYGILLSQFDSIYRAGQVVTDKTYHDYMDDIKDDKKIQGWLDTFLNVVVMTSNGNTFMHKAKATSFGETFECGYSKTVNKGDCDFTSKDTLWDFKTSKNVFNKDGKNNKATLQLMMYFLMGKKSGKACFKNLTHIGVFNPRLNTSYRFDMRTLDLAIVKAVCDEVIVFDDGWVWNGE